MKDHLRSIWNGIKCRFDFRNPTFERVSIWFATFIALLLVWLGVGLLIGNDSFEQAVMSFNHVAWVTSNLLIAYIGVVLIVFVIGYYALFDPNATTGGTFIFRFAVSLFGLIGLVFIGVWIDPVGDRTWYTYPGDVLIWRPIARLLAYTYVAYTISALAVLLVIRKWYPHKLRTAIDRQLIQPRKLD